MLKSNGNVKQIIILRKDLGMRKGKMVAQGAHASMKAILDHGFIAQNDGPHDHLVIPLNNSALEFWLTANFKKITVSVNSEEELDSIYQQAKMRGCFLPSSLTLVLPNSKAYPRRLQLQSDLRTTMNLTQSRVISRCFNLERKT